ncbi:MAG TPA: hypothetical protein VMO47_16310 [Rhodothermales bacterium]|nr:hypothetical protein [Rhodothermales bacterium]
MNGAEVIDEFDVHICTLPQHSDADDLVQESLLKAIATPAT